MAPLRPDLAMRQYRTRNASCPTGGFDDRCRRMLSNHRGLCTGNLKVGSSDAGPASAYRIDILLWRGRRSDKQFCNAIKLDRRLLQRVSRRHQTMSATRAAFLRSGRRVRATVAPPTTFNRACYWWRNLLQLRTLRPATLASATGQQETPALQKTNTGETQ